VRRDREDTPHTPRDMPSGTTVGTHVVYPRHSMKWMALQSVWGTAAVLLLACAPSVRLKKGAGGGASQSSSAAGACTPGTCSSPCAGNHLWSHAFAGGMDHSFGGLAIDGSGNVVMAGLIFGPTDFGAGNTKFAGGDDPFLAKWDATGKLLWAKTWGGPHDEGLKDVDVDADGNIYVTGFTDGDGIDLGTGNVLGTIFVAKLDPNGNPTWVRGYGTAQFDEGDTVRVDSNGRVVVAGQLMTSLDFGDGSLAPGQFLLVLDAGGQFVWSKRIADGISYSMSVDRNGGVLVAGEYQSAVDLGGTILPAPKANGGLYLARIGADKTVSWARPFNAAGNIGDRALAVGATGTIFLGGDVTGMGDLGKESFNTSDLSGSQFIAAYDASGQTLWTNFYGMGSFNGQPAVFGLAPDAAGSVAFIAELSGPVDFGGGAIAADDLNPRIAIGKLDGCGKHLWSRGVGSATQYNLSAVRARPNDNLLFAGKFGGSFSTPTINFGGATFTDSDGGADLFLAELSP